MNNEFSHSSSGLYVPVSRRLLFRRTIAGTSGLVLADLLDLEEVDAARRRDELRDAKRHFKRMVAIARHNRREAIDYFRKLRREIQRDIKRGMRLKETKLKASPRPDRGRPPRRARRVRGQSFSSEQVSAAATCPTSFLVEQPAENGFGWHAASLFQEMSWCYEDGRGIVDFWCNAWEEVYLPFTESSVTDECRVTLGGKGYNTVKAESEATFVIGIELEDAPDFTLQNKIKVWQQVADDGGFWAGGSIN